MAIVALPVAVTGCLSPTDITLEITSDLACSKLDGIAITAGPHDTVEAHVPDVVAKKCTDRDGGGSFGTLVLTPSSSPTDEITVRVVAGVSPTATSSCKQDDDYGGCIVARRVLHYDEHTSLTLPIELHGACLAIRCLSEDATCVDGVCLPAKIDDPSRCTKEGCSQDQLFAGQTSKGCLGDLDFVPVGTLPGTEISSLGTLSSDGQVVFGYSAESSSGGLPERTEAAAFRCASLSERSPLLGPLVDSFVPTGTNASGTVMVGTAFPKKTFDGAFAVHWSSAIATEFSSTDSVTHVNGCDRDTCTLEVGDSDQEAAVWRWPSHDPINLRGEKGANTGNTIIGVDPQGKFAFGSSNGLASLWDISTHAWHLLDTEIGGSLVLAATPNGGRLVGALVADSTNIQQALSWNARKPWTQYEAQKLDRPAGLDGNCEAISVSDHGSIVAGWCMDRASNPTALIWEERTGFAPILASTRVEVPKGWTLLTANVSADGKIIAGDAESPEHRIQVYIARLK